MHRETTDGRVEVIEFSSGHPTPNTLDTSGQNPEDRSLLSVTQSRPQQHVSVSHGAAAVVGSAKLRRGSGSGGGVGPGTQQAQQKPLGAQLAESTNQLRTRLATLENELEEQLGRKPSTSKQTAQSEIIVD